MRKIAGAKLIAPLPANSSWAIYKGEIIVAAPDRAPYIQHQDGTQTPISPMFSK